MSSTDMKRIVNLGDICLEHEIKELYQEIMGDIDEANSQIDYLINIISEAIESR